jgi:hypothetical protein
MKIRFNAFCVNRYRNNKDIICTPCEGIRGNGRFYRDTDGEEMHTTVPNSKRLKSFTIAI